MLDGVEADGAHPQRGLHRHMQVGKLEHLEQPQDLHVLAPAGLEQPCLRQLRRKFCEAWQFFADDPHAIVSITSRKGGD